MTDQIPDVKIVEASRTSPFAGLCDSRRPPERTFRLSSRRPG
jgi:hypothetical protein